MHYHSCLLLIYSDPAHQLIQIHVGRLKNERECLVALMVDVSLVYTPSAVIEVVASASRGDFNRSVV